MINTIHAWLHRPEKGWDPVPCAHAETYAGAEWASVNEKTIAALEDRLGGFAGKRVLDLGGGPGHYSAAFARRGARVVWHDVSGNYRRIAMERCGSSGLEVEFSLGYLEDAAKFPEGSFDFVFSRICWYYCKNDRAFARIFHRLVKPGGAGYVDCPTAEGSAAAFPRTLLMSLNRLTGIKIGHVLPPRGGLARWFSEYPNQSVSTELSNQKNDRIYFVKSA